MPWVRITWQEWRDRLQEEYWEDSRWSDLHYPIDPTYYWDIGDQTVFQLFGLHARQVLLRKFREVIEESRKNADS